MVKKLRSKKRGIHGGVPKHAVRASKQPGGRSTLIKIFHSKVISKASLARAARGCQTYMARACSVLCLFPFKFSGRTGPFDVEPAPETMRPYLHKMIIVWWILILGWRSYVTLGLVLDGELGLLMYMSLCYVLISLTPLLGVLGTTLRAAEMISLQRAAQPMLRGVLKLTTTTTEDPNIFSNTDFCLKIMLVAFLVPVTAINASLFSFAFDSLPVCVFQLFRTLGLLQNEMSLLESILWRVLLYPLELLTLLPATVILGYNCLVLIVGLGVLQNAAEHIRNLEVNNREEWGRAERSYKILQLYSVQCMRAMGLMLGPALSAVLTGVVILLYVTLRPAGLPFIIHLWFPIAGALMMFGVMWLCYDAVTVKRIGNDVVYHLQRKSQRLGRSLPILLSCDKVEMKELILRGRALKPLYLAIGEFSEITLEVMVSMWDEVINQLIFLLTL